MNVRNIIYTLLIVLVVACSGNLPKGVLNKKKMVPILVDIHLAESINNQKFNLSLLKDSLPENMYLSICEKYKVDRSDIEKSLIYYGKHTKEYLEVYNEVLDVLSEMDVKAKSDTIRPVHVGGFDLDTSKVRKDPPSEVKSANKIK
jgi:hypothetical protein